MIRRSDRYGLFTRRLLEAMAVAPVASAALIAACGGTIVEEASGTTGAGAGSSSASTSHGAGGNNATATDATTVAASSSGGAGGASCSIGASPPEYVAQGCIPLQDGGCPSADTAAAYDALSKALGLCVPAGPNCCGMPGISAIDCGPTVSAGGTCCYEAVITPHEPCGVGRVFTAEGGARIAQVVRRDDWHVATAPAVSELDAVTRAELARAWARDAQFEHASVASFARLALELLAVGAPADLVREAQLAMGDEIQHAERCFALASAYAARAVGPGPLSVDGTTPRASLAQIASAAVREGCIGETIGALLLAEACSCARDKAVRHALDAIAAEEARHAATSWKLVAWAYRTGGEAVRVAVAEAFAALEGAIGDLGVEPEAPGVNRASLRDHGRLSASARASIARRALAEVVAPAAAALMASSYGPTSS